MGFEGEEDGKKREEGEDKDDDEGRGGKDEEDEDEDVKVAEDDSCDEKPEMKAARSKKPFYYMVFLRNSSITWYF